MILEIPSKENRNCVEYHEMIIAFLEENAQSRIRSIISKNETYALHYLPTLSTSNKLFCEVTIRKLAFNIKAIAIQLL